MIKTISDTTKETLDAASIATAFGSLLNLLPAIAALFSIVWTGLRIYDRFKSKRK